MAVESELCLGQLEPGGVVRGAGTVLAGGHVGLLGLDAVIQRIEPLGDFQCLAGKGRGVLGGAGKCLIDLAIGRRNASCAYWRSCGTASWGARLEAGRQGHWIPGTDSRHDLRKRAWRDWGVGLPGL
jgi:hypothetical protein